MIKVTYPLIAKHYKKHPQTIKQMGLKLGGVKTIGDLFKLLNYYENKNNN